jgi:urea ABC transporter urea binding protein
MLPANESPTLDQVRDALGRILSSASFARSPQASRFLKFVVEETIEGRGEQLKAYTVGVQALGVQGDRSDPDSAARMQAGRTRKLLTAFYASSGQTERVRIVLPTGQYQPKFEFLNETHTVSNSSIPTIVFEIATFQGDSSILPFHEDYVVELLATTCMPFENLRVARGGDGASSDFQLLVTVVVDRARLRILSTLRCVKTAQRIFTDRFDVCASDMSTIEIFDDYVRTIIPRIADVNFGAIARYNRAISDVYETDPEPPLIEFYTSYSLNTLAAAVGRFESALSREPANLRFQLGCAQAHAACFSFDPAVGSEYLDAAEDEVRAVLAKHPYSQIGHLVKGQVHFHRREGQAARRELRRAIELNPLAMHPVATAGMFLALIGEWQEGLSIIDQVFARYPDAPGFFHLAHCAYHFFENGDPEEAHRRAELLDSPDLPWSPLLRAVCFAVLGRRYEASRVIAELLAKFPEFPSKAKSYLSGFLYAESLVEAFVGALREAGLRLEGDSAVALSRNVRRDAQRIQVRDNEVRVGILHSMSGTMAICERHLVQAARLAIDEINSDGGVLGRQVTGITEDGRSSPEVFAVKARKLLHVDKVSCIFGCWTSACRKAVRPIVEHANSLLWYPVQYEGLERSRNIIYTGSCLNQQIAPATHWALGEGYRRFYLVGSDYVFPRTANYLIRAIVEAAGGIVIGEEYRPLGEGKFRPIVEQIRRMSPDLVFNTVNGSDNLALFREFTEAGLSSSNCPVMSFSLSELDLAGLGGGANGHFACWSYFHSVDAPENRELIRRFRNRYGDDEVLSDPTVTAYSQVHLWKQVVEKAGSFGTDELLGAIVGRELSLGGDTLEVRSNNHVKRRAMIGRIRPDNQFDVVWRTQDAISPQPWLGVEDSDVPGQELVMDALSGLSEVVDRNASLEREISQLVPLPRRKEQRSIS